MLSNDANILKIKHEILYQVAKLAYAGQLEEKKEELPYELLPGPQAKYRCCVYKEREVVRQRIRLAEESVHQKHLRQVRIMWFRL